MRTLELREIPWLAEGAAILGAGGGGSPYVSSLALARLMKAGKPVVIADPDELEAGSVGPVLCGMGAPTASMERLPTAGWYGHLVRTVAQVTGREPAFLVISEIGGGNALMPLIAAAETGLPVVDADANGRAFPELPMNTFMIAGLRPEPLLLDDGKGVCVTLRGLEDAPVAERYARALTWSMGGSAAVVHSVRTAEEVRAYAIRGTLGLAIGMGRHMAQARQRKVPSDTALREAAAGTQRLFEGKIVDIERQTRAGFAYGRVTLEGLGEDHGSTLVVDFQNEFLCARRETDGPGATVLTVPDLLVLLEQESGMALGTEQLRYGLRVWAMGIPAPVELKGPDALRVVGPRAFGYDLEFHPLPGALEPA